LSSAERLALIRAIASLEAPEREVGTSTGAARQTLAAEQEAWFARPAAERQRYAGEYIAVLRGEIVGHDPNQRALYLRVRAEYGRQPVLIIHADWPAPPSFTVHTPRLER
jgi:hypothetical protein